MNEIIKGDFPLISGAIDRAKFLAQQYYNNNRIDRIVISARFISEGLDVEYEEPGKPDTVREADLVFDKLKTHGVMVDDLPKPKKPKTKKKTTTRKARSE